jgi:hypothetical protein
MGRVYKTIIFSLVLGCLIGLPAFGSGDDAPWSAHFDDTDLALLMHIIELKINYEN